MAWLVAEAGETPIGGAVVLVGWHNPRDIARAHDLTAVRRKWLGQGVAAALKRCQIAWAKESG